MLFIEYPKCSTCCKAKKYLDNNKINYTERDIIINPPTTSELKKWIPVSGKDINKWFNTSGLVYKELKLKDKINTLSYEEKLELLASNGKLIKRPLLILENKILIGFKEKEYDEEIKRKYI